VCHSHQEFGRSLVESFNQTICLRVVGARDPVVRLSQCKRVLVHTADKFTSLVTDDDLSASISDENSLQCA